MAQITTTIALGRWDQRQSLNFVPVNEPLKGRRYGAFGLPASFGVETRRPYRVETVGSTTYVQYDDDSVNEVPIYKMEEI